MKKLGSILCAFALMLAAFHPMAAVMPVSAATDVTYTIGTIKTDGIAAGKTFTVDVTISKTAKICMVEFLFAYDATKVKAISSTVEGLLTKWPHKNANLAPVTPKLGNPNIGEVWITGMSLEDASTSAGERIATITFKALTDINKDLAMYCFQKPLAAKAPAEALTCAYVDGGVDILGDGPVSFPDVTKSAWYYDAVQYVAKKGFMSGFANGNFGPATNMQRQDFVLILSRIAGADLTKYQGKTGGFEDVAPNAYYASAVAWAVDNGIVTGYQSGKFGVGDSITREQVCTIFYRYKGSPKVSNADSTLKVYPDRAMISAFAKDAVVWASQNGVMSGVANGAFSPTTNASRAQVATIVMRMDQANMF